MPWFYPCHCASEWTKLISCIFPPAAVSCKRLRWTAGERALCRARTRPAKPLISVTSVRWSGLKPFDSTETVQTYRTWHQPVELVDTSLKCPVSYPDGWGYKQFHKNPCIFPEESSVGMYPQQVMLRIHTGIGTWVDVLRRGSDARRGREMLRGKVQRKGELQAAPRCIPAVHVQPKHLMKSESAVRTAHENNALSVCHYVFPTALVLPFLSLCCPSLGSFMWRQEPCLSCTSDPAQVQRAALTFIPISHRWVSITPALQLQDPSHLIFKRQAGLIMSCIMYLNTASRLWLSVLRQHWWWTSLTIFQQVRPPKPLRARPKWSDCYIHCLWWNLCEWIHLWKWHKRSSYVRLHFSKVEL